MVPDNSLKGQTVLTFKSPLGHTISVIKHTFSSSREKPLNRISFIAGLHGDELEGVSLCYRLIQYLRGLKETCPESFLGDIHIYPAMNPQALSNGSRMMPFFSTDLNRNFGERAASLPSIAAEKILEDIRSCSDLAVDLHASNLHLKELPQIRITEGFDKKLIPLARHCNVDLIWVHPSTSMFEFTLAYNLNQSKIPTLVIEAGIGHRIDMKVQNQIFKGLIHLLKKTEILKLPADKVPPVKSPLLVNPDQVVLATAKQSGFFISKIQLGTEVSAGTVLGEMIDPLQGILLHELTSPASGILFTLREMPIAYEGAVLARIARENMAGS